ncbi:Asp-domain-containing protein [Gyrodon lividus]|nr:Asp-domain-containing protein [Gyrodon lividus]
MRFNLVMVITALPVFVAAAPQRTNQRGKAIPMRLSQGSPLVSADKSVNFEALKFHVASTRAKILRGFDNFEKNTGTPHPSAVKGIRERASGRLPLDYTFNPNIWFGTISIGTPPQLYTAVEFDTGSGHVFLICDLVLPGIDCDDSCNGHNHYNPQLSSSAVNLITFFSIGYENGDNAYGAQYTDNVTIVGLEATDQTLGVAWHYSYGLQSQRFAPDGMLGMAFQAISGYNQSPLFQTLVTQGQTDEPVFAFSLADPEPELYIGGANPNMYIGDFSWTPVIQRGYWEVRINNIVANGQVVVTNLAGIIDTGTYLIHGPTSDVANLYEAMGGTSVPNGNGFYTYPCDAVSSVSFTVGGTSFPIPSETFNVGTNPSDPYTCIGGIVAVQSTSWIVGSMFLGHVYTAFDLANMRVGFATLA